MASAPKLFSWFAWKFAGKTFANTSAASVPQFVGFSCSFQTISSNNLLGKQQSMSFVKYYRPTSTDNKIQLELRKMIKTIFRPIESYKNNPRDVQRDFNLIGLGVMSTISWRHHKQHIRAASCRSRLESEWETPNFDPLVEPELVGDRAESWQD